MEEREYLIALILDTPVKSEAPRPQGGASVGKPSGTASKPPGFALRATPRSPLAIPPRASARGILAKASKNSPFSGWLYYSDVNHKEYLLTTFPDNMHILDLSSLKIRKRH